MYLSLVAALTISQMGLFTSLPDLVLMDCMVYKLAHVSASCSLSAALQLCCLPSMLAQHCWVLW